VVRFCIAFRALPKHKVLCFAAGCSALTAENAHTPSTNERVPRIPHETARSVLI
jgi:hypothetical protein